MLRKYTRGLQKQHIAGIRNLVQLLMKEEVALIPSGQSMRSFAKMPSEYEAFYKSSSNPVRKVRPVEVPASTAATDTGAATQSQEAAASAFPSAPPDTTAASQKYAAESATRWMFPWEKRQMGGEKGPLTTFERLYWGVFVSAIAFLMWSKLLRGPTEADKVAEEEKADREVKRVKAARLLVAGQALSEEDEEHLEGMTPQEIQDFVETHIGSSDPFEGLSPEEINELLSSSPSSQNLQLQ